MAPQKRFPQHEYFGSSSSLSAVVVGAAAGGRAVVVGAAAGGRAVVVGAAAGIAVVFVGDRVELASLFFFAFLILSLSARGALHTRPMLISSV